MTDTTITNADTLNAEATNLDELAQLHFSRLSVLSAIASGTADDSSVNATQPTSIVKRPWIDPPEGYFPFDETNSAVIPLPVVGSSIVVVDMRVPDGYDGVINFWSWNFTGGGFDEGSGDIVIQLLRNNAAVRNFDKVVVEKGTIAQPRPISPIRIFSTQRIQIVATHAGNGLLNGNLVGSLLGYFYPSKS